MTGETAPARFREFGSAAARILHKPLHGERLARTLHEVVLGPDSEPPRWRQGDARRRRGALSSHAHRRHRMDTTRLFSLEGRSALITGGSRGIGRMIAEGFLAQGARVYISARKAAACDQTAKELSAFGHCVSLPADVSTVEGAQALVDAYAKHEGALDILVNNAGAAWGAPYDEFPESGWDKVVDLNLKTPFFLTQALTPMLQEGGHRPPGEGDQHRLDRRHLGQSAGNLLVRGQQGRPDPAHAAHGAAPRAGPHRRQRDRAGRLRLRHEQGRARPRRRDQGTHSGGAHRRRRRTWRARRSTWHRAPATM